MKLFYILILHLTLSISLFGNTDTRAWTLKNGDKLMAALVSYNEDTGNVLMMVNDDEQKHYHFDDFSNFDRAWLIEWTEISIRINEMLEKLGGKIEHIQTTGKYPTDAYVYHPSPREDDPVLKEAMILFNASGKPLRYLQRHIEAAENRRTWF